MFLAAALENGTSLCSAWSGQRSSSSLCLAAGEEADLPPSRREPTWVEKAWRVVRVSWKPGGGGLLSLEVGSAIARLALSLVCHLYERVHPEPSVRRPEMVLPC